ERFHFNTAISSIMELVNASYQLMPALEGKGSDSPEVRVFKKAAETVVLLIAPFAPHISEELWSRLGSKEPVYRTSWPAWDEDALRQDEVEMPVQVNGKVRGRVKVAAGADEAAVKEAVLADPRIKESIAGKEIKKFVCVKDKIVNMVVA
ncbi:partial Leucine--tRNA ligase, partial [Anaerolineae bacterium]